MTLKTAECIRLWESFEMNGRVKSHSLAVNKVAMIIARKMKEAGEDIDLDLVNAGSLLHDIDKLKTLDDEKNHGLLGEKWLAEVGLARVGKIVRNHCIPLLRKDKDAGWEDKIVSYADKRCLGAKTVNLRERLDYIKKRYSMFHSKGYEDYAYGLEKEIFDMIDIRPEDII